MIILEMIMFNPFHLAKKGVQGHFLHNIQTAEVIENSLKGILNKRQYLSVYFGRSDPSQLNHSVGRSEIVLLFLCKLAAFTLVIFFYRAFLILVEFYSFRNN